MTWVKLDDQFTENPKVRAVTDRSFRLHVAGLCHCGSLLTDGVIERHKVPSLLPKVTKAMVEELLGVGLWLRHPDGFEVKDYLKYNPTREKVLADRDAAADRKRKWLEKQQNGARNSVPNGAGNGERSAAPPRPAPKGRGAGTTGSTSVGVSSPAPSGGDDKPDTSLGEEQVELNVSALRSIRGGLHGEKEAS
jgi:hypothetical protein